MAGNRNLRLALSFAALLLGLATIIVTIANGGGILARGILFGVILSVMGSLRIWLTIKHDV